MVDTFGTGKKSNQELVDLIRKYFDLRPAGIIKMLDLRDQSINRQQHMDISEEMTLIFLGET